jgi:hypothetical protein
MKILLYGSAIFCLALIIHLLVWKIRVPKGQTKALLRIFFGALFVCLIGAWLASKTAVVLNPFLPQKSSEYLHIFVFFISMALAYIAFYSAVEVDSPSLVIVMNVVKGGREGLDKEGLEQLTDDDLLVKPRIRDLAADKMVNLDSGKYKLTPQGFFLIRLIVFYRKLLNAGKGG